MKCTSWRITCATALVAVAATCLAVPARGLTIVDFEDLSLPATPPGGHFEGVDITAYDFIYTDNPWQSRGVTFHNYWAVDEYLGWEYTTWHSFSYSNETYTGSPPAGLAGEYTAVPNGGANGSENYTVWYQPFSPADRTLDLPAGQQIESFYVTNNTYAWDSMKNGDSFANPFGYRDNNGDGDYTDLGDNNGDYPDWFKLTITGLDGAGDTIAAGPIDFYLADYRFANPADDYIVDAWELVDLSGFDDARKLQFELDSSDYSYGSMVTPGYFLLDELVFSGEAVVPEPRTMVIWGLLLALCIGMALRRGRRGSADLLARQ